MNMAGIVCAFDKKSADTRRLVRLMDHRGRISALGTCFMKDSEFTYGIVSHSKEQVENEKNGEVFLLDNLFDYSSDILRWIGSTIEKDSPDTQDLERLKDKQGIVLINADADRIVAWRSLDGQRPLYYAQTANELMISTEKKVLWHAGLVSIQPLQPGHRLTIDWKKRTRAESIVTYDENRWTGTKEEAIAILKRALLDSIDHLKEKKIGVLFSGGVDSSLLAYLLGRVTDDIHLYSASFEGARDRASTVIAAESLDIPLASVHITSAELWEILPELIFAIESTNRMDIEIAVPFYLAAKHAKTLRCEMMVSGQGPDEQFAGYARYVSQIQEEGEEALEKQLRYDLSLTHESNISRDERVVAFAGLPICFPYLDSRFTQLALSLPASWKIHSLGNTQRKVIFREFARSLGLPKRLCEEPKKATQFSSGSSKGLLEAVSRNVIACKDMTRKEVDDIIPVILRFIGEALRRSIDPEEVNDLGIDLQPTLKFRKERDI